MSDSSESSDESSVSENEFTPRSGDEASSSSLSASISNLACSSSDSLATPHKSRPVIGGSSSHRGDLSNSTSDTKVWDEYGQALAQEREARKARERKEQAEHDQKKRAAQQKAKEKESIYFKQGWLIGAKDRYYCVLDEKSLELRYYANSDMDDPENKPKGVIDFSKCNIVKIDKFTNPKVPAAPAFQIVTKRPMLGKAKEVWFMAEDLDQRDEWMEKCCVIAATSGGGGTITSTTQVKHEKVKEKTLTVEAIEARNLLPKEGNSGSTVDAYVVAKVGKNRAKTKVIKRTTSPQWNKILSVCCDPSEKSVHISVWDHDVIGSHGFLGELSIPFSTLPKGVNWWTLHPRKDRGKNDRVFGEVKLKFALE